MSSRADRQRLRRAYRRLLRQHETLLTLELDGLVALTVHSVSASLTLPLDADTCDQVMELLLTALSERRHWLRAEAARLRGDASLPTA